MSFYLVKVRKNSWARGALICKLGILRLQEWSLFYNLLLQKSTNAQVWVWLYGLNQVLWHMHILSNIARGIGVPFRFDLHTLNGDVGHFARVLVDVDLITTLPNFVIMEVDGMDIEVELHYENFPLFCYACKNIGHGLVERKYNKAKAQTQEINNHEKEFLHKSSKQVYMPVKHKDLVKVGTLKEPKNTSKLNMLISNIFSALEDVDLVGKHSIENCIEHGVGDVHASSITRNGKVVEDAYMDSLCPTVLENTGLAKQGKNGKQLVVLDKASIRESFKVLNLEELVVPVTNKQHTVQIDDNTLERREAHPLAIVEHNTISLEYVHYLTEPEENHAESWDQDRDDYVIQLEKEDLSKALVLDSAT